MSYRLEKFLAALSALLIVFALPGLARADNMGAPPLNPGSGNNECPVGLVSGQTLDDEFGGGSSLITHCVHKRHDVKVMFQINRFCGDEDASDADCKGPYALGNMVNVIKDYEITAGMKRGIDYQMIAVVYGGGGKMLLKGNKFESRVKTLMDEGVKFYFCQNTLRGFIRAGLIPNPATTGIPAADSLIDGVEYVTAGITSVFDHEALGWANIAP